MNIRLLIRVVLGLLLIASGLLKLYPTEFFENQLLSMGVVNATWVQWFARLIISLEVALGLLLIFNLVLRWAVLATGGMLIVYTAWLLYDWFILGNHENCGCFGSKIPLTPAEAIVKNVIMLFMLALVRIEIPIWSKRGYRWLCVGVFIVSVSGPMILSPPMFGKLEAIDPAYQIPFDYKKFGMSAEVAEGNTLVCFFLAGCKHCRLSSARLQVLIKDHPEWPAFIVLAGAEIDRNDFITSSGYGGRSHGLDNAADMIQYTGNSFPVMVLMTDGIPKKTITMYDLNEELLSQWFSNE